MKTLLLILIFGKSILLTPEYIDIEDNIALELNVNVSAITSGAYIQIDVTRNIKYQKGSDISEFRKQVQKLYPPNTIEGILIENGGNMTALKYGDQNIMFNENETLLTLNSEEGVSIEKEFIKVKILSEIEIKNALITWVNNKK